jgi:hypothetical protein
LLKGKKPQYRENVEINNNVNVDMAAAVDTMRERIKKAEAAESGEE